MVELVTLVAVGAGVVAVLASVIVALGITVATTVSPPKDKNGNTDDNYIRYSTRPLTYSYRYRGFGAYPGPFAGEY